MKVMKCKDGVHRKVPCGQCIACRLNKVRDWTVRIMHESRYHKENSFVTLTFAPEYQKPSLDKRDIQLFLKRLRKRVGEFRYFLCGEYGENHHLAHYHLCLFGIGVDHFIWSGKKYDRKSKGYYQEENPCWKFGNVYIGDLNYSTARYVASYVNKKLLGSQKSYYEENNLLPEFTLMSRRPGIGDSFVKEFGGMMKRNKAVVINGKRTALPRFYENKIWNTEELKKERQKEKQDFLYNGPEIPFADLQREKNILGRVNFKNHRSMDFEKAYKDFKNSDVLGKCRCASN